MQRTTNLPDDESVDPRVAGGCADLQSRFTAKGVKHMWNDFKLYFQMLVSGVSKNEEGQTLVEYALILALVSVLLVGALTALQGGISGAFSSITSAL
jgi:pilus assembly protein Flp/PilA